MAVDEKIMSEKVAAVHVEETLGHGAISEAKHASDDEHAQTLWQALRENRKAVLWSFGISLSIVMEGYDTILMPNFMGYPGFQKKYGQDFGGDIGYQVSTPWQTGLNMASTVGAIFGGLAMGGLAAKYGYRWVMICAMALLNLFILVVFFAPSAAVLLVGQVLCGLCWGVFATVGPAYASEVCPTKLRGYMTVYVNLCWAMGQFIAAGVLRGCLNITSDWTYRIPFAVQWAWPVPIMVICYFAPESPWYLVRHDRLEEAKRSVQRLAGDKSTEQINGTLAMIVHTTKLEAELESQQAGTSYLDCFKGTDLRRTEICCMAFAGQILSGSTFAYQPTYFFTTAGLSDNDAYSLNLGSTAIAFCGTVFSWFLITYVGRRKLYVTGQALLCGFLFLIGILNASSSSQGALWGQAAVCILWVFTYAVTVGPIAYAIVSETSSMRLRPLTVALARTSYQIVNIVSQVLQAYFMNPTAWNVNGKTGFFWGCTALLTFVWAFFRLPEAKDRTPEELDILFSNETKARQFAKTEVDAYAHAVESDRSG